MSDNVVKFEKTTPKDVRVTFPVKLHLDGMTFSWELPPIAMSGNMLKQMLESLVRNIEGEDRWPFSACIALGHDWYTDGDIDKCHRGCGGIRGAGGKPMKVTIMKDQP